LKKRLDKLEREEISGIIDNLVHIARGTTVICPYCDKDTGIVVDIDVEACKYLVDRIMGKPKQQTDVSITEKIVLTADQSIKILARARQAQVEFEEYLKLQAPKEGVIHDTPRN
jgi:hypothetical protein